MNFSVKVKNCPFCGSSPKVLITEDCDHFSTLHIKVKCCVENTGKINNERTTEEVAKNAQKWIDSEWNYREKIDTLSSTIEHSIGLLSDSPALTDCFDSLSEQLANDLNWLTEIKEVNIFNKEY